MIDEELLNKFDRIQDLPVSEEMLGAYMEGNLNDAESILVSTMTFSYDIHQTSINDTWGCPNEHYVRRCSADLSRHLCH